ncbi:transposase [Streptomyces sp. NPDC005727]|uniref:transposase n=1 Tax=Streptomyces sp. NPDC005727 TaxID=3157053 RepID=UPI0033C6F715
MFGYRRKLYRSCTRPTIRFPDLVHHHWRTQRLWSGSYFSGPVGGAPLSILKQYIEQQNRPL